MESTVLEKDIGVLVSNNLKPSDHCAKAAKTANTVLGQIARAFHFRDRHTFVQLYKLYVRPHLEFAAPAWSPWTKSDIESLERVQKRALAMVSGLGQRNYYERLTELNMTTLEERRVELDMVEVYKIMTGGHTNPDTWFTGNNTREGARVTRQTADPFSIRVPAAKLELRKHFFSARVVEKWNNLPLQVKQCKSAKMFKMAYRQFTKSNPAQASYTAS